MKNFCVIDIGTNAVKIKIFSDGRYVSLRNKPIGQVNNNVSKDDILRHVQDFIHEAKDGYQVPQNQVYIYATEGVRRAPDSKLIQQEIEQKTQRRLHVLDPKREARLSALGGLSSIELKMADALPITMTLGGLKDGIAQENCKSAECQKFSISFADFSIWSFLIKMVRYRRCFKH